MVATLATTTCRDTEPEPPLPAARLQTKTPETKVGPHSDITTQMLEAKKAFRHSSDGGGKAWIEDGPHSISASTFGTWTITYEAGSEGIAENGMVIFMTSPFWGWSAPQNLRSDAPGYVEVTTSRRDLELDIGADNPPMLGIAIRGDRLRPGDQLRIRYGAATRGARADRFAESASRFWIGVDGDGDGTHRFLSTSPTIEVTAGRPAQVVALAPPTVRPGSTFDLHLSVLDRAGNAGVQFAGTLHLESNPAGMITPSDVAFDPLHGGTRTVSATAPAAGIYTIGVRAETAPPSDPLETTTNPIVVTSGSQIYWADLHGHSALSDGTGTPRDYFRYARDVAGLNVVALTDHDHWGVLHLDENPQLWSEIQEQTNAHHAPGSFVTILGYEWTSWDSGHRHVLYFDENTALHSSIDPTTDTPQELWRALQGRDAITVAHHSAGGPIATDWSIAPDPVIEPITEVVSVHGVSEAADAPSLIYKAKPGNFVRDALAKGYRFGFVGSGDSHDGHPGLAHLSSGGTGGLAAIIADELTRPSILRALRERRVYATSGPRIYLRFAVATHPMGSVAKVAALELDPPPSMYIHAIGTAKIQWLDIVRSGTVLRVAVDETTIETNLPLPDPQPGEYVYVRVVQEDGALAWSSPVYFQ